MAETEAASATAAADASPSWHLRRCELRILLRKKVLSVSQLLRHFLAIFHPYYILYISSLLLLVFLLFFCILQVPCELQLELLKPRHTRWLHFSAVWSVLAPLSTYIHIQTHTHMHMCVCPRTTSYNRHCNWFHLFQLFNFDFCLLFLFFMQSFRMRFNCQQISWKHIQKKNQPEKKANKLSTLWLGQVGFYIS